VQKLYALPMFYIFIIGITLTVSIQQAYANESEKKDRDRMVLYKKTEAITQIPWYYIAAMDQYERNIAKAEEEAENEEDIISIQFDPIEWYGPGNTHKTTDYFVVSLFQGIGMDGNGDGKADLQNEEDRLYTAGVLLSQSGFSEEDIKISLWNHYERDLTVKTIINIANIYKKMDTIELNNRDFPVDLNYNYSYNNTWGDRRGFGGNRIHEGTDIFASYGSPVKSTTYGVVELKGWNLYGGWRIGIRDIYNIYHYYAHLNSYEDDIEIGDIVQPGDIIGSVGSSGYGPPGTSGKFPPHLHYGMYRDNGNVEWSFDPYPYLKQWEQIAKDKE